MIDHFATNVHALLNATKGYEGGEIPEASDGRHIRRLAEWVACQRDNPFVNHTLPQLLAIDFADATLAWVDDPTSDAKIAGFRNARTAFLDSPPPDAPNE
ncbi:MAG TPA: hypothetical protein VGI68_16670 [Mycobacterium sp.]